LFIARALFIVRTMLLFDPGTIALLLSFDLNLAADKSPADVLQLPSLLRPFFLSKRHRPSRFFPHALHILRPFICYLALPYGRHAPLEFFHALGAPAAREIILHRFLVPPFEGFLVLWVFALFKLGEFGFPAARVAGLCVMAHVPQWGPSP
jgi:hypothetical protein